NFTVNRLKALEICEAVKGENISWVTSVRADGVDNDILAAMKKSGMRRLIIGFESGSEKILRSVNKKVSVSRYNDTVKLLKRHDVLFHSNFIIGMPEEDEQTIKETEVFCINNNLIFGPSYATPFPGTKLYEEMRDRVGDEKKYIYSLAKMNFSKRAIINLTKMSMRKLVYLRNRTVVNSTVNLIWLKVRFVPVFIIKPACWCYILIFNTKNALIAKMIHSITQRIYKFLAKSHG
ncbi:MAG: radical SAM protein, partial [Candidatus Omnitrophica bacterium]|nr:radical SAM protein [Candidatus Omnitrophota bacterium]